MIKLDMMNIDSFEIAKILYINCSINVEAMDSKRSFLNTSCQVCCGFLTLKLPFEAANQKGNNLSFPEILDSWIFVWILCCRLVFTNWQKIWIVKPCLF
jgi:hypothetical protein